MNTKVNSCLFRIFAHIAEKIRKRKISLIKIAKFSRTVMGKPQIYFANMGHGEAIAFELNGQWYLRDFGEYSGKPSTEARCYVKKLLQRSDQSKCVFQTLLSGKTHWNAIVSHSHRDHFSGFEKIFNNALEKGHLPKKIFNTSYLPLVYIGNNDAANYSCLVEGNVLLASFLLTDEEQNNSAMSFLKSDVIMAALSDKLIYCSSKLPTPKPFNAVYCPLTSASSDSYERLLEIQLFLDQFYDEYFSTENDRASVRENVKKIQEILGKYHKTSNGVISVSFEDAKSDIESIDKAIETNKKYTKKNFNFEKLPQNIKNILDDCSLAFDVYLAEKSKWLFLGDNNDAVLNVALPENIKYDGVKTSHHGTRGARVLIRKNITSDVLIACVGHENDKFNPIEDDYAKKGIISIGVPPDDVKFSNQGGMIKRITCLKYENRDSTSCGREPYCLLDGKGSKQECLACKICR